MNSDLRIYSPGLFDPASTRLGYGSKVVNLRDAKTYEDESLRSDLESTRNVIKVDSKRLSICSTSTESILLEADMMLTASRSASKKKKSAAKTTKQGLILWNIGLFSNFIVVQTSFSRIQLP